MVIDSHALFWWLEEMEELPARARRRIDRGVAGDGVIVSAVTFWEMRMKELRGLIEPKTPVADWEQVLRRHAGFRMVPTDGAIWVRSANLRWDHKDPADRIIAATALESGVAVLTKDARFHRKGSPVEALW